MSKKTSPIDFTKEYDNPFDELKERLLISMKKAEISNRKFQIFTRVFITIMIIILLTSLGFATYQAINDFQMKSQGREFCLASGYIYGDSSCVEKLSDGVRVHKINYAEKQWSFVKE